MRPGLQFQERELVERFEVSKSPIRDALLRLEAQGLVEVMPRKGYRVRRIDLADVRDMYEMRHIYERECVSRIIDQPDPSVRRGLDDFRGGPREDGLPAWLDYNRRFHAYFAENCGNARLAASALEIADQFDRLTYMSVSGHAAALSGFVDEHDALIEAVQTGNRREALTIARDHIDSSRRRVLDSLQTISIIDTNPERP